jgi:hypothetical protein
MKNPEACFILNFNTFYCYFQFFTAAVSNCYTRVALIALLALIRKLIPDIGGGVFRQTHKQDLFTRTLNMQRVQHQRNAFLFLVNKNSK